jgi:hypothetical protein
MSRTESDRLNDDVSLLARVDALYDHPRDPFLYNSGADESMAAKHCLAYGEVTSPKRLFAALELTVHDCFYDLGSGRGQCVLAASLLESTMRPCKACGIELVRERHDAAVTALGVLRERQPVQAAACLLMCANALTFDLGDATKVFINNAVFSDETSGQFAGALAPAQVERWV